MPVHLAVFLSRRFHGAVSPAPLAAAPFGALLFRAGEAALRFPLNFVLRLVRSYLVQGLCAGPVGRWATIRRSEVRRVGKECVSTCISRWSRSPSNIIIISLHYFSS